MRTCQAELQIPDCGLKLFFHLLKSTDSDLQDDINRQRIRAGVSRLDYRVALGRKA
jgi:hypothetical protein